MTLKARHLYKSFRHPQKVEILSDLSLDLEQGQSVAIMGRSGTGKTTLLHILGTLEKADEGFLEIGGVIPTSQNSALLRNEQIGFIFQAFNLLDDFTALENVLMPARIARRSPSISYGKELLHLVGLADRAHFPAKMLSGGEKQRVAIARALCNEPSLILADEPSGNLDTANALAIGELLLSLVKQKNKSLVLVTHDTDLASLCDTRFLLKNGQLHS